MCKRGCSQPLLHCRCGLTLQDHEVRMISYDPKTGFETILSDKIMTRCYWTDAKDQPLYYFSQGFKDHNKKVMKRYWRAVRIKQIKESMRRTLLVVGIAWSRENV
jgi:hypothetical protein